MTDPPDLPPEGYRRAELPHSGPEALLRDSWDMYAREWIAWTRSPDQPDSYLRFHREHFLPLIPAPGRLTLDLACGEGRIARDLKYSGHRVLGVDWSFTMCKAAATHINDPISVIAGDAARLPIADAQVDCVIAFMCLQDIDDMSGTITEIARVLQDGKRLALAIVHPMYSGGNFSMTGNPNDDFVIKRSYFKPELQVSSDTHNSLKVTFFREHRPLQQYVHALLGAGFSIDNYMRSQMRTSPSLGIVFPCSLMSSQHADRDRDRITHLGEKVSTMPTRAF